MTNVTLNLGIEKIKGSIIETKGEGKWIGEKLKFAVDVDFSQLTAKDVKSLMIANWKIGFNAKIKPLGEDRVRKFFRELKAPINAVEYLPGHESTTAGLFKECYGRIKGARDFGASDADIVAKYGAEFGVENIKAVLAGKNPWKVKSTSTSSDSTTELNELQKSEVLKIAKQIQEEMEELDVADRLMEVVKLCGYSEKLRPAVIKTAGQIIK